jgi:hypothetical protein
MKLGLRIWRNVMVNVHVAAPQLGTPATRSHLGAAFGRSRRRFDLPPDISSFSIKKTAAPGKTA